MSESKIVKDTDNILYYKLDESSKYNRHMGKNIFNGYWKRKIINPENKKVLGIYYMILKDNIPNGEVNGFLEYDKKEILIFQGSFEMGNPIGIHKKFLFDEEKKTSVWIGSDYFEKYKLIKVETNINGTIESGTSDYFYKKYANDKEGKKEKDDKKDKKSRSKISKTDFKKICDDLKIEYESDYPTKKDLLAKCDDLKIKYSVKTTIIQLLDLIKTIKI